MFLKTLIFLSISLSLTLALTISNQEELQSLWSAWKTIHNKPYMGLEDQTRFAIFSKNYQKVLKYNAEHDSPKLGLNKFADLTPIEFKMKYSMCGFKETDQEFISANTKKFTEAEALNIPDKVDWRQQKMVTKVKDQGQCGSCWAFSAVGILESQYAMKTKVLAEFSEQQIVSCDTADEGCNGGWPYLALNYTAEYGLETELNYPYTAYNTKCKYNSELAVRINNGFQFVAANNSDALKAAVADQPVSVAIEADQKVFQLYSSGVISGDCGANLDHAVIVVGYTKDYFIVKNSWGGGWGHDGYVYISTNGKTNKGQGACGILAQPVFSI